MDPSGILAATIFGIAIFLGIIGLIVKGLASTASLKKFPRKDHGISNPQGFRESEVVPPPPTPARPRARTQRGIFVSYRREDSADVTGRIYDRLTQAFEKAQVFKDVDSIPLGLDFRKHLQQTVSSCDVVLVVVGDRWLTSTKVDGRRRLDDPKDFVRIELETALQRDIPVIPVLVRGASVPEEGELPPILSALAYRNGIAVRSDPDFHRDMDRLIQSLKTYLAALRLPTKRHYGVPLGSARYLLIRARSSACT